MPLQEVSMTNARVLQDIADAIAKSHKVLVVTGAGISTNCGIPDFRSKDGLYNMIPTQVMPITPPPSNPSTPSRKRKACAMNEDEDEMSSSQESTSSRHSRRSSNSPASRMKGQDLFHARVFQNPETTEVFYQFIASLRQKIEDEVKETSATHKFIRVLRDAGRLMRCYTQNIDGLEQREGLCMDLTRGKGNKRRFMKKYYEAPRPDQIKGTDYDGGCEVVQLHGELTRLRCTMCSSEETWTEDATAMLLEGNAPECEVCATKSEIRQATGKRGLTVGGLRPNIVLYGEEHPQNTLLSPLVPYDISSNPDVLIIMGTSLKVHGLQKIIRDFAKAVHNQKNGRVIFVNNTRPAESVWEGIIDDFVAMDCDAWVKDLKLRREDLWLRQGEITMTETKTSAPKRKRKSAGTEEDISNTPSKKVKFTQNSHLSVDIPKIKRAIQHSIPNTPKSHSTPSRIGRGLTKGLDILISTPGNNRASQASSNHRHDKTPTGSKADTTSATRSPRRPTYSPITPAFSPLMLSPRSRSRSTTSTPSKLRTVIYPDDRDMSDSKENHPTEMEDQEEIEDDDEFNTTECADRERPTASSISTSTKTSSPRHALYNSTRRTLKQRLNAVVISNGTDTNTDTDINIDDAELSSLSAPKSFLGKILASNPLGRLTRNIVN